MNLDTSSFLTRNFFFGKFYKFMKKKIIDALDFKVRQQLSFRITPNHHDFISDARISVGIFSPKDHLIVVDVVGDVSRYLYNFFLTDGFYLKNKTQRHCAVNLYTKATRNEVEFSGFVLRKYQVKDTLELDFLFVGCSDIGKITFFAKKIYERQ